MGHFSHYLDPFISCGTFDMLQRVSLVFGWEMGLTSGLGVVFRLIGIFNSFILIMGGLFILTSMFWFLVEVWF